MPSPFLYNRKLRSLLYKNAPRGSHCGGKANVASATRRRRRILLCRILSCITGNLRFLLYKNAPRGSHWVGKKNIANAKQG